MKSKAWTQQEIDILRSGFKEGKLVKTLAIEVGRSETAVNKFLSRSGIRTRRWKIVKPSQLKDNKILSLDPKRPKIYNKNDSFMDILEYLKSKGYIIAKLNPKDSILLPDEKYLVNNKPCSAVKILIMANKLRTEEHKSIFRVSELICE